jgi:hypothetical protein
MTRIYQYIDEKEYSKLPTENVWLEEDYPNNILTNTPNLTLHEYEVWWDENHNLPPRHIPEEERNFYPYTSVLIDNFGRKNEYKKLNSRSCINLTTMTLPA